MNSTSRRPMTDRHCDSLRSSKEATTDGDQQESSSQSVRIDARLGDLWPQMTVRTWSGVLARRDPDWRPWDDDDHQEAQEAGRLHELRGLILAQVAEIEDLLRHILAETRRRIDGDSRLVPSGAITAGAALARVESLLDKLSLAESRRAQLALVRSTIRRRNQLVHATVRLDFTQLGPYSPREPTIALLTGQHDRTGKRYSPMSAQDVEGTNDQDSGEIDESILEQDLKKAYEALDAALDIWEAIDRELPGEGTIHVSEQ